MAISLNHDFMRGELKSVEKAAVDILTKQQQDFINILRYYGGEVIVKVDGTYS